VKLNVSKTRAITFSRKTNGLCYVYKIQDSSLPRTDTIKDLDVQLDSKLHFHAQVDYIFSQSLRPLGLIRTLTYSFYTLDCLLLLYSTLVRPNCCMLFSNIYKRKKAGTHSAEVCSPVSKSLF
jgi:hypothetical protein